MKTFISCLWRGQKKTYICLLIQGHSVKLTYYYYCHKHVSVSVNIVKR